MPRYVALVNWTDEGVRNYRNTVERFEGARAAAEAVGARISDIYWTVGSYDLVGILEAPDDETAAAAMLAAAGSGSVRTTTLRAFEAEEMRAVIAKIG